MFDLDPAAIESLLHDGARQRGVTIYAYRNLVQATAIDAGVTFERALQVVADFHKMPSGERKVLVEQLAILEERAARYGVSVAKFVTILLGDDDGDSPSRLNSTARIAA